MKIVQYQRRFIVPRFLRIRLWRPALLMAICLALFGCVLPPAAVEPRTISRAELEAVSKVNRGGTYAKAGRLDLAELEYRKALRKFPDSVVILNDLGYVLMGQGRNDEAKELFLQALQIEPKSAAVRDNLARLLYAKGDVDAALSEYSLIVDNIFKTSDSVRAAAITREGIKRAVSAIRNLAILNFLTGRPGDGKCYAELALAQNDESYGWEEHSHLLLSFERSDLALPFLRELIVKFADQTSARVFFEYGLALLSEEEFALAAQSFTRIPMASDTAPVDRQRSRVFRMLSAQKMGEDAEYERLLALTRDEDLVGCAVEDLGDTSYWPAPIVADVKQLLKELCTKNESFF